MKITIRNNTMMGKGVMVSMPHISSATADVDANVVVGDGSILEVRDASVPKTKTLSERAVEVAVGTIAGVTSGLITRG